MQVIVVLKTQLLGLLHRRRTLNGVRDVLMMEICRAYKKRQAWRYLLETDSYS